MLHTWIFKEQKWEQRIAVDDGKRRVSYQMLRQQALIVAATLQNHGVQRNDRVGLVLKQSVEAVISMFAVLLCGATYVPVDPRWPQARQHQILKSISARVVLVEPNATVEMTGYADTSSVLAIDDIFTTQQKSTYSAQCCNSVEDIAYILFTSGSKGKPKGVMVSHRAAWHFAAWAAEHFQISEIDHVAGVSAFTFDLSVFDIFSTLSRGATLYLYDTTLHALPTTLAKCLERDAITILYTVPTVLMLLESRGRLNCRELDTLRLVLFAGEVFPISALNRFRKVVPATVKYHNLYGPTETNVCTAYELTGDETTRVPIGSAIPGVRVAHHFSPESALYRPDAFELHVYGATLMSGYWGMGDTEAWVYDSNTGERGYRTGDVCCIDPQGNLCFLGRIDSQLKINGFRIEASEVESVLQSDPDIMQAVVFGLQRGTAGYGRMLACVVLRPGCIGSDALDERLYRLCRDQLPLYACPSAIRYVDSVPTTSTGKVDRIALAMNYQSMTVLGNASMAVTE